MSGYEEAPGTELVATHCAICGRPLLEADSVQCGIGPICRKRYGYDVVTIEPNLERALKLLRVLKMGALEVTDPEVRRVLTNRLIYRIAARDPQAARLCALVDALGYSKIARKIAPRVGKGYAKVHQEGNLFRVTLKVSETQEWSFAMNFLRGVSGWTDARNGGTVPAGSRIQLWETLQRCLPKGSLVEGYVLGYV